MSDEGKIFVEERSDGGLPYKRIHWLVVNSDTSQWLQHGTDERWYRCSKQLHFRTNFVRGKQHGHFEAWYCDGQMSTRSNWDDGKRHGVIEGWHLNGKPEYRGEFINDKEHGLHQHWDPEGVLIFSKNYGTGVVDLQ